MLYDYDESPQELKALRDLLLKTKNLAEALPPIEMLALFATALRQASPANHPPPFLELLSDFAEAHAKYKQEQFFTHFPEHRPARLRLVKP